MAAQVVRGGHELPAVHLAESEAFNFRTGQPLGDPSIAGGHHRIALAAALAPDRPIAVRHHVSIQEAMYTRGYT